MKNPGERVVTSALKASGWQGRVAGPFRRTGPGGVDDWLGVGSAAQAGIGERVLHPLLGVCWVALEQELADCLAASGGRPDSQLTPTRTEPLYALLDRPDPRAWVLRAGGVGASAVAESLVGAADSVGRKWCDEHRSPEGLLGFLETSARRRRQEGVLRWPIACQLLHGGDAGVLAADELVSVCEGQPVLEANLARIRNWVVEMGARS